MRFTKNPIEIHPTIIYGLIDPLTKELRYIGMTTRTLDVRLTEHVNNLAGTAGPYLKNWIKKIKRNNFQPQIFEIETVLFKDWVEAEKFWISYFKDKGFNLVNLSN